ncbi:MAG TPA: Spy/CpxP family protein refolding chaperone [Elusimicrobiota bacterium]|nr:Spy/CpxP family protein refolding chaperone [Elusimicrobiota bacterium]
MKRYICAALAAALLAPAMLTVRARAQDDDAGSAAAEPQEGGKADHAKMAEHMKKRLELTDDQAAKLKDAMKAHHEGMQPLWQQVKDSMRKLGEQLKAKAPDSDIQSTLDSLKSAHKSIAAEEEKFQDSLGFLTATQRAKMLMGMMHMRRERMMHGKKGPKGADKDKDQDEDEKSGD